ncbi:hypothetical protein GUJ93_ZPchr0004g39371 [Zizania palustris]|uniref:DUF4378 domain-containing protein n=1 Tax=Zizania palustris TaxID=103762 RepID=A0A8J5RWP1_ZIZPA|nr:hypothetical protein GUJ93_ZPchr0004g39371 [Zizania palustris]
MTRNSKARWFKQGRPATETHPGCMAMMHLIFAPGAGCVGRPPAPATSQAGGAVVNDRAKQAEAPMPVAEAGLQAPRNSLDLDADQLLREIHIGVQIEPAFDALASHARPSVPPSEAETPRTPSLVARLMGIDGLPDSPAAASTGTKLREKKKRVIPESISFRQPLRSLSCNIPGDLSRSLPDTPRASMSSARAAPTWDVVDHPRLSLQVLKENVLDRAAQYMSMPTSPTSSSGGARTKKTSRRRDISEGRSAKEHAREIVRQAKETVANRKSKKNAAIGKENTSPVHSGKENAPPASNTPAAPPIKASLAEQQPHAPRIPLAPKSVPPPPPPPQQHQRTKPSRPPPPPPPLEPPARATPVPAVKGKRPDGCERFATRIQKQAPASTHQSSLPAQPALASSTDRDIVSGERKITSSSSVSPAAAAVPLEEDPEYVYMRTVLERGGFMRARAATGRPFKGHSLTAPVDPLVFHLLELDLPVDEVRLGPLRHRWNRKLLFHLTQEMLAELLLGLDPTSPAQQQHQRSGAALLARLWRRARSFPAADCRVVQDIDALVAADLGAGRVRRLVEHPAVAEESGDVADEVAERVLEALLDDCCSCFDGAAPEMSAAVEMTAA